MRLIAEIETRDHSTLQVDCLDGVASLRLLSPDGDTVGFEVDAAELRAALDALAGRAGEPVRHALVYQPAAPAGEVEVMPADAPEDDSIPARPPTAAEKKLREAVGAIVSRAVDENGNYISPRYSMRAKKPQVLRAVR